MPNPTYISCLQCGRDFVPQKDETLFCSESCRDAAIEEGVEDAKRRMRRNGWGVMPIQWVTRDQLKLMFENTRVLRESELIVMRIRE